MHPKLPTRRECLKLLDKYGTSEERFKRVKQHSIVVARVAVLLARKLKKAGEKIDVELVEKAALLHDIEKANTVKNWTRDHTAEGYKTLVEEGYPEIALIVKKHTIKTIDECKTWEEKLVLFADTCVNHDKVVSWNKKYSALIKRYKNIHRDVKEMLDKHNAELEKLRHEIFSKLKIQPEDLPKLVK